MGNRIFFYAPSIKHYETGEFKQSCGNCYFIPVSITGARCELNCDHCGGKILATMRPTTTPDSLFSYAEKVYNKGAKGMLISGGSDKNGVVLIRPFLPIIARIKQGFGFKIVAHLGILDEETAKKIKDLNCIDVAMMDIVGSNDTLREVYHLKDVTTSDFENSLRLLCEYEINVVPHIVIGLHYGKILGEYNALEVISRYPVKAVVLVGLTPQKGTKMEGITPTSPSEMREVFSYARRIFPKTPVLLGCIRPLGPHKYETEILALKSGLDGIAYPSEGIVNVAYKMGLKPKFSEMCCSLYDVGIA